jgi:DNA-binding transcriptional MerR regulator
MPVHVSVYTIGALAKRTGCSSPTIRYYEEISLLPKAQRRPSGQRVYNQGDFSRLTFIRRCRDLGFSIEQVRDLVELTESPERDCVAGRDLAQARLDDVRLKLEELQALEQNLVEFVETCTRECAGGPGSQCVVLKELTLPQLKNCCG